MIHIEELAHPFKCEFEGLSYKILIIHKGKQHKIGAQAEFIHNEVIIKDLVCTPLFFKEKLQKILMTKILQLEKLSGIFN